MRYIECAHDTSRSEIYFGNDYMQIVIYKYAGLLECVLKGNYNVLCLRFAGCCFVGGIIQSSELISSV